MYLIVVSLFPPLCCVTVQWIKILCDQYSYPLKKGYAIPQNSIVQDFDPFVRPQWKWNTECVVEKEKVENRG